MKKLIRFTLITALAFCCSFSGKAQGGDPPFVKGSNTIGFSIGFGDYYDYGSVYGGWTVLPSLNFTYDHGSFEKVGPGTIGIGGVIGIKNRYYKYSNGDKYTDNSLIVGARGTYHLTLLADKNNKFDPYGGILLGLRFRTRNDRYYENKKNDVYPTSGLFVGAKYNFTKNFGAFAELGYDISFFKIGLNLNFGN